MTRLPAGRILAALTAVVAGFLITQSRSAPQFRAVAPGVEFSEISGVPYCRHGSAVIAALRIDPREATLEVRHYAAESSSHPIPIAEWAKRTGAVAVLNAGQYYPDFSYMGLLVSNGVVVSAREHPTFRAAFVAGPQGSAGDAHQARVIDLETERLDRLKPGWRQVAQSFMLFDERGRIRVRNSTQVARRTAVAQDARHQLIVLSTEGGYTLYDFARLLKSSPLGITHAMSMDGGEEAQLYVNTQSFRYANVAGGVATIEDGAAPPLPAVIVVRSE